MEFGEQLLHPHSEKKFILLYVALLTITTNVPYQNTDRSSISYKATTTTLGFLAYRFSNQSVKWWLTTEQV
jgi:hypothetical protein